MMAAMPLQPEVFDDPTLPRRFYNLKQVAAMLATTQAQVLALVRVGDLPAIKIGGRGQWRVEGSVLDGWIEQQYEKTRTFVAENPVEDGLGLTQDEAVDAPVDAGRVRRARSEPNATTALGWSRTRHPLSTRARRPWRPCREGRPNSTALYGRGRVPTADSASAHRYSMSTAQIERPTAVCAARRQIEFGFVLCTSFGGCRSHRQAR